MDRAGQMLNTYIIVIFVGAALVCAYYGLGSIMMGFALLALVLKI